MTREDFADVIRGAFELSLGTRDLASRPGALGCELHFAVLAGAGIKVPFPQRDVRMISSS